MQNKNTEQRDENREERLRDIKDVVSSFDTLGIVEDWRELKQ